MLALVAAILFLVALVLNVVHHAGDLDWNTVLTTAGFLCAALYMAGIGKRTWR